MTSSAILLAALLMTAGAPGPPAAQENAPKKTAPTEDEAKGRLREWPRAGDLSGLRRDIRRLRAARTPEMVKAARTALLKAGAAAAPHLIPLLDKERDADTLRQMREILEAITEPEHTRLLSEYFHDHSKAIRIWSLSRCAELHDPGLREAAEGVLERLEARGKKADPQERVAATLCLVATGSTAAITRVIDLVGAEWNRWKSTALLALEAVRGERATDLVGRLLAEEDRNRQLLGLRLLAGCMDTNRAKIVAPFLDVSDNGLRIATINLLRLTLDGDPPLERLPVFEAIERANKWKARLK